MAKLPIRRLHSRVRASLEHSGVRSGQRLIVAVSGGPDSLTLLYALNYLQHDMGFEIHGAHLNHKLRGEASEADAQFAAETFSKLGMHFTMGEADVESFRETHRLSLEEAAREVRYEFLTSVAAEQNADAIALGHTSDDQAETVLMHIIRGSGLTGLKGMEPRTRRNVNGKDITLIRPLLDISRKDILDYCNALNLEPRQDESNLSSEIARNRVRLELIPLLEQYNPSIRDALVRLSRSSGHALSFIDAHVETEWNRIVHAERDLIFIDRNGFSKLPSAVAHLILRRAVQHIKGDLDNLKNSHVFDMARLMSGKVGKSLHLPGGLKFKVGYDVAELFISDGLVYLPPPIQGEHALRIPGETVIPGWRILSRIIERTETKAVAPYASGEEGYVEKFDYDSLGIEVLIRSRTPGDRIQPLGMTRTKKIQDVMVDAKIPRSWRDSVPLVASPKGIAWIVGCRIAEWARVREDSLRLIELRFERA